MVIMCHKMKPCVFFAFASPAPRVVRSDRFVFSPALRTRLLISVGDSVLISSHVDSCPTTHMGFSGPSGLLAAGVGAFSFCGKGLQDASRRPHNDAGHLLDCYIHSARWRPEDNIYVFLGLASLSRET